jgi:stage V sporulation protein R
MANKGKMSWNYQKLLNLGKKENFDQNTNKGQEAIFTLRKNFSDFMLINTFVDQDFVNMHDLFVTGKRYNKQHNTVEYYVKSRKAEDYKKMLLDSLYHPPIIYVDKDKSDNKKLYLVHRFENKQLYKNYIPDTLVGIEYLWGGEVNLQTTEIFRDKNKKGGFDYKQYRLLILTWFGLLHVYQVLMTVWLGNLLKIKKSLFE